MELYPISPINGTEVLFVQFFAKYFTLKAGTNFLGILIKKGKSL
jgi:hypothetical protein